MSFFRTIFSRQFLFTLILIGLLAVFAWPLIKNWRQKQEINKEVAGLEQQVNDLQHKNSSLQQVLDYMQSAQFVESEARTKLNYKKPGEQVVVVESRPGTVTASNSPADSPFDLPEAPTSSATPRLTGNINNWLDYFFAARAQTK